MIMTTTAERSLTPAEVSRLPLGSITTPDPRHFGRHILLGRDGSNMHERSVLLARVLCAKCGVDMVDVHHRAMASMRVWCHADDKFREPLEVHQAALDAYDAAR